MRGRRGERSLVRRWPKERYSFEDELSRIAAIGHEEDY